MLRGVLTGGYFSFFLEMKNVAPHFLIFSEALWHPGLTKVGPLDFVNKRGGSKDRKEDVMEGA